jgi:L-asparagine transporter-like permease
VTDLPLPAEGGTAAEPPLVTVGDIVVSQHWVTTPSGVRPLSQVNWTVTPMYQTTEGIPTWAIVCAILFFVFCLLGLLFLLVKEQKTTGQVQVTVQGAGLLHTCYLPVNSPQQVIDISARVDYARSLTMIQG